MDNNNNEINWDDLNNNDNINWEMRIGDIPVKPEVGKLIGVYRNVTVEIVEFPDGEVSIGWYRQENTERIE